MSLSPIPSGTTACRNRGHRPDTDIHFSQIIHLTHRAVYHNTFPAVLHSQCREFRVNQRTADRPAPSTRRIRPSPFFREIKEQSVIFKAFYGGDLPCNDEQPRSWKTGFNDIHIFLVNVTKLGGVEGIIFIGFYVWLLPDTVSIALHTVVCKTAAAAFRSESRKRQISA